jgi:hypothetical protein
MASSASRVLGDDYGNLRIMDAREVLRQEPIDLQVPDGANWTVSPNEGDLSHHLFGVQIKSVEDLQILGHVPRGIKPSTLLKALEADDEQADEQMRSGSVAPRQGGCGCGGQCGGGCAQTADDPYRTIRRAYHPNLAQVLSNHWGVRLVSNDAAVKLTHKWLRTIGIVTVVNLFHDIAIGRDAVLTIDKKSRSLYARNILIARTGTLRHRGGYIKVWANAVDRWDPAWVNIASAQLPKWVTQGLIPWRLEQ